MRVELQVVLGPEEVSDDGPKRRTLSTRLSSFFDNPVGGAVRIVSGAPTDEHSVEVMEAAGILETYGGVVELPKSALEAAQSLAGSRYGEDATLLLFDSEFSADMPDSIRKRFWDLIRSLDMTAAPARRRSAPAR